MSARLRRLAADYEKVKDEFLGHPYVEVTPISGNPPERYQVTYRVKGLRLDPVSGRPTITGVHRAEIYLHSDYPREKPKCVMLTEVFHPNFGSYICIGDHWAAGETLADVIYQIGEMIQYQNYNPKSPLNAMAAVWAKENERLLPVGNINLPQPEPEIEDIIIVLGGSSGSDEGSESDEDADSGIVLGGSSGSDEGSESDDLDIQLG